MQAYIIYSRSYANHSYRDTVSSVGLGRHKLLPSSANGMGHVCFFRHALALDERRVKFLPEYAHGGTTLPPSGSEPSSEPSEDRRGGEDSQYPHTKEVWFRGSHSDMCVFLYRAATNVHTINDNYTVEVGTLRTSF